MLYYNVVFMTPECRYRRTHSKIQLNSKMTLISFFLLGDEIFTINGTSVSGLTHQEAISMFKEVKQGQIIVTIGRRTPAKKKTITISTEEH